MSRKRTSPSDAVVPRRGDDLASAPMKTIDANTKHGRATLRTFNRRAEPSDEVRETVAATLAAVRAEGDDAVSRFAEKFDRVRLPARQFAVPMRECASAWKSMSPATRRLLRAAHRNIRAFATRGLRRDWTTRNAEGAVVGEVYRGFDRVGLYVPGGTAPLVSSALMTVTLAEVAGCREIVVCTPCGPDRSVNRTLLAALHLAGATEVFRIGGIQAIAAMAYGTTTIGPVAKIFGPGNQWVIEAKRQVFGRVAVDQLPGPSEIVVLADESGRADWIAADLVAQAEHGHGSQAILVTPSRALAASVQEEVARQLATLNRREHLTDALSSGGFIVLVSDLRDGIDFVNAYAPEHLSLVVRGEKKWVRQVRSAGAIFLGNQSPVAVGDYLAGPSHTLPTGGAGKSFPGLTVDQFQRRTSIVKLDQPAMRRSAPLVAGLAELEGLGAHAASARIRLDPP